ncbi:MarR family transcriptional regulator [Phenylobacterium sp.]|uniref:MarR family winged helix-turn-helix transcriptional regulator n=1 Tax=Phenylobacterium sp. TaxID=1871053 RepID=UPI002630E94E|nr:MarR family transcriptional regulator [Phenylobacterium sp.]
MDVALDKLDILNLAEALRPALLRVSRRLRQEGQKAGISAQDSLILAQIQKNPGIGVCDLADAEQTSRPTMSSHVKRLEAAGFVRRSDDAEDGRRSGLAVTAAGVRRIEAIKRHRNDWLAARLKKLSPAEREKLADAAEPLLKLASVEP